MFWNRNFLKSFTVFDQWYFCFLIFLPCVYVRKLVDPVLMPRQLMLGLFLLVMIACILYKIRKKELIADFSFLRMPVFLFLAVFLMAVLFSFSRSIALSESLSVFARLSTEAVFYVITTYLLIQNQLKISVLIKAMIIFCVIVVIFTITQVMSYSFHHPDFFDRMLNVTGTFGHKNLLAFILFLTIPFLIAASDLQKGWKFIAYSMLAIVIFIVWLLQAKAVLGAVLLVGLILTVLYLRNRDRSSTRRITKVLAISGLIIFIGICGYTFSNREKFPRIFDKKSSYERLGLWDNSMQMIDENPVLGVGAGNWQIHFPKYGVNHFFVKDVRNGMTTFQRPHNDYLWVASEMGIIGIIAYLAIFVMVIWYLIRLRKGEWKHTWLYKVLLITVIGYLLIASVDFPLERIEHQVLLLLIFSIITAHFFVRFKQQSNVRLEFKTPFSLIIFLIPVLFSCVVSYNRCKGEYHTKRVYFFQHQDNWKQMHREARAAVNTFYKIDPTSIPLEWYSGVALFSSGDINGAKASFEKAYMLTPYNMHVLNNLASSYESSGDHQKAEEFYLKALAISSGFEEARLNLSAVYYNTNQSEKAFDIIEKCNVNTPNPKYVTFLGPILNAWITTMAGREQDPSTRQKLMDIANSKMDLVPFYVESRKAGGDFKSYLLRPGFIIVK